MATNPHQPGVKNNLQHLAPMAYISTGLLAIFMLIETLFSGEGYSTVGAALLLVLTIGNYLRYRWTITATILLAAALFIFVLSSWNSQTLKPPIILLVFPPIIILFNVIALICASPKIKQA